MEQSHKKRKICIESDDEVECGSVASHEVVQRESVQVTSNDKLSATTVDYRPAVSNLPGKDTFRSGNYLFEVKPELINSGGKLRAMKLRHCKLFVYEMKNNVKGAAISAIQVQLSALPSEINHRDHCSKVDILIFNVCHKLSCTVPESKRPRLQELVLRTLLDMYHPSVRVATDGHLEYQGLQGMRAYLAMQRRFINKPSSSKLHVVVFREGAYYTGDEYNLTE
jgi:hypothetical protein